MREIHLEERPTNFKQVVGQREACEQLIALGKSEEGIPHCLLFTGPSGCGKTTLARIVRQKLHCSDSDFCEVNAAANRGIEMVRDIQSRVSLAPMGGDSRVWLIDECHQLTGDAQGAFLKLLEEPPAHVYLMLATTDPQKLRPTIRTRCTEIKVRSLTESEIVGLVDRIAEEHTGKTLASAISAKLAEVADGSARKALVLLQQIIGIPEDEEKTNILQKVDTKTIAFELCRAIMAKRPWKELAGMLCDLDDDPEGVRYLMLAFFSTAAIGKKDQKTGKVQQPGNAGRAVAIMEEFRDNYFDTKKAGLIISCWRACNL